MCQTPILTPISLGPRAVTCCLCALLGFGCGFVLWCVLTCVLYSPLKCLRPCQRGAVIVCFCFFSLFFPLVFDIAVAVLTAARWNHVVLCCVGCFSSQSDCMFALPLTGTVTKVSINMQQRRLETIVIPRGEAYALQPGRPFLCSWLSWLFFAQPLAHRTRFVTVLHRQQQVTQKMRTKIHNLVHLLHLPTQKETVCVTLAGLHSLPWTH